MNINLCCQNDFLRCDRCSYNPHTSVANMVSVAFGVRKGNLTKEPITTMRLWLRGRCPEVTRALIILATAHDGMQAKQIRFKHLHYTSLLTWEAGNQAQISTQHLG